LLPFNIDRAMSDLSKVTLKGGVVGKVTYAVIAVSLAMAAIAWSARDRYLSYAALALVFLLAFVMLWRLINFADRHPQAALLEGGEFLAHQQIVHASKSVPAIPLNETRQAQPELVEGLDANPALAQLPDSEPPALPLNEGERN
jgi:hypothetical protein